MTWQSEPAVRYAITRIVGVGNAQVTTICEASGHGATSDAASDMYAHLLRDERKIIGEEFPDAD